MPVNLPWFFGLDSQRRHQRADKKRKKAQRAWTHPIPGQPKQQATSKEPMLGHPSQAFIRWRHGAHHSQVRTPPLAHDLTFVEGPCIDSTSSFVVPRQEWDSNAVCMSVSAVHLHQARAAGFPRQMCPPCLGDFDAGPLVVRTLLAGRPTRWQGLNRGRRLLMTPDPVLG